MKRQNELSDMELFTRVTGFHYGWKFTAIGAGIVLSVMFLAAVGEAIGNLISNL